ncbi:hypothetical protein REJC140_00912 [Pseudorhizobium endolithicum]|uniref:Amino acid transporter n=1 Tax=Pseudorhizobium endolithicum TaxID=1191678 RepID=A0ABN7JP91_9HYPH|nr:hypothetical protein [Pseudorhizobium endolithicum]CAD6408234.1 hypothetical protein REQ54_00369 [Rhizobium sp. Q54]CAD7040692.1 hypothetical protein REJC140_00912 [Pseudorhizobium endolithicum]
MTDLNPVEIEQTKLLANAFDRASTACITVGVVTPLAAMLYGIGNVALRFGLAVLTYLCGWLLLALFLHYLARQTLRRLA